MATNKNMYYFRSKKSFLLLTSIYNFRCVSYYESALLYSVYDLSVRSVNTYFSRYSMMQ